MLKLLLLIEIIDGKFDSSMTCIDWLPLFGDSLWCNVFKLCSCESDIDECCCCCVDDDDDDDEDEDEDFWLRSDPGDFWLMMGDCLNLVSLWVWTCFRNSICIFVPVNKVEEEEEEFDDECDDDDDEEKEEGDTVKFESFDTLELCSLYHECSVSIEFLFGNLQQKNKISISEFNLFQYCRICFYLTFENNLKLNISFELEKKYWLGVAAKKSTVFKVERLNPLLYSYIGLKSI